MEWPASERMVREQIESRGIRDERVLEAMRQVPRHWFVPRLEQKYAYDDRPLPIGFGQTISQPYIVALMTELLEVCGDHKVLEIGSGSGYQSAILSRLAGEVFTIEINAVLAERARAKLMAHGFDNVTVFHGDGYRGLPEEAPFDRILLTAAPEKVPESLVHQLRVGGRMVVPVGVHHQKLDLIIRHESSLERRTVLDVQFVPMVSGGPIQHADGPDGR